MKSTGGELCTRDAVSHVVPAGFTDALILVLYAINLQRRANSLGGSNHKRCHYRCNIPIGTPH